VGFSNERRALARKFFAALLGGLVALAALELSLPLFPSLLREPRRAAGGQTRVLCLGNSYTAGVGATLGHSYCDRVESRLRSDPRFAPLDVRVVNQGFAGRNSTEVLRALPAQLQEFRPSLVLLMTGEPNRWNEEGYQSFLARGRATAPGLAARLHDWLQRRHVYRLWKLLAAGNAPDERLFPGIAPTDARSLGFAWFGYLYPRSEKGGWPPLTPEQWREAVRALTALHGLTKGYHFVVPLLLARIEGRKLGDEAAAARWYRESLAIQPSLPHAEARADLAGKPVPAMAWPDTSGGFAAALRARPADPALLEGRFHFLLAAGRLPEALAALEESARWNPFGFGAGLLNQFHGLLAEAERRHQARVLQAAGEALTALHASFPSKPDFHPPSSEGKWLERWVESDIAEIASYLRARNVPLLLQTYPPRRNGRERGENRAIRAAARAGGIPLADVEELFLSRIPSPAERERLYSNAGGPHDDHLNDEGYARLGDFLYEAIVSDIKWFRTCVTK
jgi:lysophospholipase L1-like esterase